MSRESKIISPPAAGPARRPVAVRAARAPDAVDARGARAPPAAGKGIVRYPSAAAAREQAIREAAAEMRANGEGLDEDRAGWIILWVVVMFVFWAGAALLWMWHEGARHP